MVMVASVVPEVTSPTHQLKTVITPSHSTMLTIQSVLKLFLPGHWLKHSQTACLTKTGSLMLLAVPEL